MSDVKTLIPASPSDVAKGLATSETIQTTKSETNILDNNGKVVFCHTIPMSSFIFPSGKAVYFRGGMYGTDKPDEIEELRAAAKVNPMITELNEDGTAKYSPEDVMREQAKHLLD